ncbi:MAG TPA: DUF1918 domain-containing protein [Conexibacter sp.]|nr:DUF1918 domain-containing protein [Conexibacter sp.]
MNQARERVSRQRAQRRRAAAHDVADPAAGDWIEVFSPSGRAPRRGQIREVLGGPGHERYRVRWDEEHESIFYPADGVRFLHEPG